ncbi:MAG TPA: BON domain-containing protein [Segetibacter sp.]|jgi:osmotically-inducible protein OsmY
MNYSKLKMLAAGLILSTSLSVTSCKSKPKDTGTSIDTTTTVAPAPTAPVEITADDALTTSLKDATKDYPGVNATVNNGEITLTGEVQRAKLPDLMQTLNSLRPKKINNQLTIK